MDGTDAVVIGSGPNGLVAAIALARKGWDVTVFERNAVPGGAIRTEELTEPGYHHDTFSAFYGLLHASPVFEALGLADAVEWAHFDSPVGAAVAPDDAAVIHRDVDATARGLGDDGDAWLALHDWWERIGRRFFDLTLAPIGAVRPVLRLARRTRIRGGIDLARMMLAPVEQIARERFATAAARALFASGLTHSDVSVEQAGGLPLALILAMLGQDHGMPIPVGGAGRLSDALVRLLEDAGGRVVCNEDVTRVVVARGRAVAVETASGASVRARHAVVADTGPRALFLDMVGDEHLPARFLDGLRVFRYGSGMFKVDLALSGPVPWTSERLRSAGVVHLTGTLEDCARAAFEVGRGLLPARPLMIVGQQSIADRTRAPGDGHTLWVEMHAPADPIGDAAGELTGTGWGALREGFLERVLTRLEHFAPGARDLIVGTSVKTPVELQAENPNLVGGDVGGGSQALHQQLVFRPVPGWFRYRTPVKGLYLCSASAHPGGGVHGMGGLNCAARVRKDARRPAGIMRTAGGARRAPRRD